MRTKIDPLLWAGIIGVLLSTVIHLISKKPFSPAFYLIWLIFLTIGIIKTFRTKPNREEDNKE